MRTIENLSQLLNAAKNGFELFIFVERVNDDEKTSTLVESSKMKVNAVAFCPNNVGFYGEDDGPVFLTHEKAKILFECGECSIYEKDTVKTCFIK